MKNNLIFTALFCCFAATLFGGKPGNLSQSVSDFYAAIDAGNSELVSNMLADDVKAILPFSPEPMDKATYQQLRSAMLAAFPKMQHKVLEVVEGKNSVAYKAIFTGSNTGPLRGNPPTGNWVEQPFLGFMKFDKNGKITEMDIQFDVASFNAQLMKGMEPSTMNRDLANRIFKTLNKHDLDALVALYSPSAKFSGWVPEELDVNGYKEVMGAILASFPDARFTIDDIVAEGDKIVVRHHLEGTHTGKAFQGIDASKKKIYVPATVTIQLQNGKPEMFWLNADFYSLLVQIGAVQMPKN